MSLNLAEKAFVNRRPVKRISALAWVVGLMLAGLNGYLYWDYLSGQGATETGFQDVVRQFGEETEMLARAREQLVGLEADELNRKIDFVNLRIQQRTFSWSRLFDVFAGTLPDDVRLSSLTPRFDSERRRNSASKKSPSEGVLVEIQGEAKSSTVLLEFLDRLFAHPAFRDPNLHQEQVRSSEDVIEFSITTVYLTNAVIPAEVAGGEPEAAQKPAEAIE